MAARYEKNFSFSLSKVNFKARLQKLVSDNNFRYSEEDDLIVITTKANLFSWGEKIEIYFIEDNLVRVRSKCILITQIFGWGKNKRNVKMIEELG